ncbi:transmembrane and TPR repeat-containing protein 1 [Caerostris extrusa]|uniref:Transmembrane and TPR repeat-containing protein 1 n=1 Tax=Caerostris extrusa TaxID=172846 RepID=A0AAV4NHY4_CAEEX|nr:transmembrane and TPR repeat-containing protein 1 [Caerostris extrusa]
MQLNSTFFVATVLQPCTLYSEHSVSALHWRSVAPNTTRARRYSQGHGRFQEMLAEQSYKLALNLDPKLAKTHQNLAVIYHIKGNYSSAEYHYKEAYKLDSSPQILLDNMRKLQRRLFDMQDNTCWRTDATLQ